MSLTKNFYHEEITENINHYDGIFTETHLKPETAVSDGDCQIKMERMPKLLERFDNIKKCLDGWEDENLC